MGRKLNIDLSTKYKSELSGVGDHGGAAGGGMGGVRYPGGDPRMGGGDPRMGGGRPPPPITHGTAGGMGNNMRPPAAPLVTPQQAVQNSVQSKSGQEAYTILVQMKKLIQNSPDQARKYLIENPAMAHQLLQLQIMLGMVKVPIAPSAPAQAPVSVPAPRVLQPPVAAPVQPAPTLAPAPARPPQPAAKLQPAAAGLEPAQQQMLERVMKLTPEDMAKLDPAVLAKVREFQALYASKFQGGQPK